MILNQNFNNMRKIIFITVIFCISLLISNKTIAQDSIPPLSKKIRYAHGLGIGAGFTTGLGLTYRYFPKRFGVQATFGAFGIKPKQNYSSGLTLLYNLKDFDKSRLFLYFANHLYITEYDYKDDMEQFVNTGMGFGAELFSQPYFSASLMTGYAYYGRREAVLLTAEVAFLFKF